jgi:hypothetical protein
LSATLEILFHKGFVCVVRRKERPSASILLLCLGALCLCEAALAIRLNNKPELKIAERCRQCFQQAKLQCFAEAGARSSANHARVDSGQVGCVSNPDEGQSPQTFACVGGFLCGRTGRARGPGLPDPAEALVSSAKWAWLSSLSRPAQPFVAHKKKPRADPKTPKTTRPQRPCANRTPLLSSGLLPDHLHFNLSQLLSSMLLSNSNSLLSSIVQLSVLLIVNNTRGLILI